MAVAMYEFNTLLILKIMKWLTHSVLRYFYLLAPEAISLIDCNTLITHINQPCTGLFYQLTGFMVFWLHNKPYTIIRHRKRTEK